MSIIEIAFPVSKILTRLVVRKGRAWSIAERVILEAVAARVRTVDDLSVGTSLDRQIVTAGLRRLMLVDWVEMYIEEDQILFRATPLGISALAADDLPHYGQVKKKTLAMLYDRIAGHVFALDELDHVSIDRLSSRPNTPALTLDSVLPEGTYRLDEMVDVGLADDEQLLGADAPDEVAVPRVAIVRVIDGRVIGLPADRTYPDLERVLVAAATTLDGARQQPATKPKVVPSPNSPVRHAIRLEDQDLIIGGREHRDTLETQFRRARSRVIVHSTFLDEVKIRNLLPLMIEAVDRGVTVDILWGQESRFEEDAAPRQKRPTADEISALLRADPAVKMRCDRLRFHNRSTGSHAKVILADSGDHGELIAFVGSCNWFASGFRSVEASVRLRTPAIVCDVVRCITRLVQATSPHEPIAIDLLKLVQLLRRRSEPQPNAKASVVVGDAHNYCVLRSRDEARVRIFIASHRMGQKVMPGILVPMAAARERRKLRITALYGALQNISKQDAERIMRHAADRRITLEPIYEPRVHAKILAWDNNAAVISSQNWLSADPNPSNLAYELGVVIDRKNVAEVLLTKMRRKVHAPYQPRHRDNTAARKSAPDGRFRAKSARGT